MSATPLVDPTLQADGAAEADQGATFSDNLYPTDLLPVSDSFSSGPWLLTDPAEADFDPLLADQEEHGLRRELVVVDTSVGNYEQLLADLAASSSAERQLHAILLDQTRDGIQQIGEILARTHQWDALHIVSHGTEGALQLGSTVLQTDTLDGYAAELVRWGTALTSDADILLYGCDVARDGGQTLVEAIRTLTGADVAASIDKTGWAAGGGDWDLEHALGQIDTRLAFSTALQQQWEGLLATVTVETGADIADGDTSSIAALESNPGADLEISLREAILAANNTAGADTIRFSMGSGAKTISLSAALPTITEATTIDASTQPGFVSTPLIELVGTAAGASSHGFHITASDVTIRGFVINDFDGVGIFIQSGSDNRIEGNWIGTDATGGLDRGNQGGGIRIESSGNTIGGFTTVTRNVIAGNDSHGIHLFGSGATGNLIYGNYIGTDFSGENSLGNSGHGILIDGAIGNTIGNATAGTGNVISGNLLDGIHLLNATGNSIQGNLIGLSADGSASLGNTQDGIELNDSSGNLIGGTSAAERNVIAGNSNGIWIHGTGSTNNTVQGNYIGLNQSGTAPLANSLNGVWLSGGATDNTIGGTLTGAGNVISGNLDNGIEIQDSTTFGNVIQGNQIGTSADGTAALGNGGPGILIEDAPNNIIGGSATNARNLISGNNSHGIVIAGTNATNTVIQGNWIGTDGSGSAALANTGSGILLTNVAEAALGAPSLTRIGGTLASEANRIAWNGGDGVTVAYGTRNTIRRNEIFNNGGLAIDLADDGVTANDGGDGDTGANLQQNHPVLLSASTNGADVRIAGNFSGTPNSTLDVDFYWSSSGDASGHGEMEHYLGSTTLTTDGTGAASFSETFFLEMPGGAVVTATATDSLGNTSESGPNVVSVASLGISLDGPLRWSADDGPTIFDLAAELDNPQAAPWNGGQLTVTFTAGGVADDRWEIYDPGTTGYLSLQGSNVRYHDSGGPILFATWSGGNDGSTPLTVTFNASATDTMVQRLLQSIEFNHTNGNPPESLRTVEFVLTDGSGQTSNTEIETIYVGPSNNAPTVSVRNVALDYAEDAGPVLIDNSLSVSDSDDSNLTSASVSISNGFVSSEDQLSFDSTLTATWGISGSFDAATGVLSFTGSSSVANYEQLLRTVTYENTSDDPNLTQRTVTFYVDDGYDGASDARNIDLTAVNDAPIVDLDADDVPAELDFTTTFLAGQGPVRIAGGDATVTDLDHTNLQSLTVTITNRLDGANELLAADTSGTGLSASYDAATGVLTITGPGTPNEFEQVLRTVTYENTASVPNSTQRSIEFVAHDGTTGSSPATAHVYIQRTEGLLLTTGGDVTSSGAPGLSSWMDHELIQLGDPNFSLGSTTDGTFTSLFNAGSFSSGKTLNAVHFVSRDISVGGGNLAAVDLQYGDLLLSAKTADTYVGSDGQSMTAVKDDVFVFRPDVPGDYSSGIFFLLLDDLALGTDTVSITLVEQDTLVGDYTLKAGSFLYSQGSGTKSDIFYFDPVDVGENTTTGTRQRLLTGGDVSIDKGIVGLDLIESTITVAGQTLQSGQILVTLEGSDIVGNSSTVGVTIHDIFVLDLTATDLGSGTGNADGSATLLLEGSDVGLDASEEQLYGLTLIGTEAAPYNRASDLAPPVEISNTGSTLLEGGTDTITSGELRFVDAIQPSTRVTYSLTASPSYGQLELTSAPGSAISSFTQHDLNSGRVVYVHNGGETTSDSFEFRVSDGAGNLVSGQQFTFSITPQNDQPTIISSAAVTLNENTSSVTTVVATDVDLPAQTMTYSLTGGADQALFSLDSTTGELSFLVAPDFEAPTDADGDNVYQVQVTADDGAGGTDTQLISITVSDTVDRLIVDTSADVVDGDVSSLSSLLANKGADGYISLREAILATNNTAGFQQIHFNIGGGGQQTIQPGLALPTITDAVQIDATTQPGFAGAPLIELDGSLAGASHGLVLAADDSTIRGLIINRFSRDGIRVLSDNNILQTNFIGVDASGSSAAGNGGHGIVVRGAGNLIGGGSSALRNVIGGNLGTGIHLNGPGADDNRIQGNYLGLDATGNSAVGNAQWGILLSVGAERNWIGTDANGITDASEGNVIGGNGWSGIAFLSAQDNVVAGNRIGTDASGTVAVGNRHGIWITGSSTGNRIGSNADGIADLEERNLISGNNLYGVRVSGTATANTLAGNWIGLDSSGIAGLGNAAGGVQLDGTGGNLIGGTSPGAGNRIAFNSGAGIVAEGGSGTGNALRQNEIFANLGLGIDLNGDGVTGNDPGDGDGGANNLQNFPVLTRATVQGTSLILKASLNGTPFSTYYLDVYASPTADASLHGEGQTYLGSVTVTTDASGEADVTVTWTGTGTTVGESITATATDTAGNTSEFSRVVLASAPPAVLPPVVPPPVVPPVNEAPQARNDRYTVFQDRTLDVLPGTGVLTNDLDRNGDAIATTLVTAPAHGSLALRPDGSFVYIPSSGFTGIDSFQYEVTDGQASSNIATVRIDVRALAPMIRLGASASPTAPVDEAESSADEQSSSELVTAVPLQMSDSLASDTADDQQPTDKRAVISEAMALEPFQSALTGRMTRVSDFAETVVRPQLDRVNFPNRSDQDPPDRRPDRQANFTHTATYLWQDLDQMQQELGSELKFQNLVIGGAVSVSGTLTAGYVVWLVRGGQLLTSLMAQMPAWQFIDPLTILSHSTSGLDDEEEDDSVEALVQRSADRTPAESSGNADLRRHNAGDDPSARR